MDNDEKKPELGDEKCKETAESLCGCILDFLFILNQKLYIYLVEFKIIEGLKEGLMNILTE